MCCAFLILCYFGSLIVQAAYMELHPFQAILPRPRLIASRPAYFANAREEYDALREGGAYLPPAPPSLYVLRISSSGESGYRYGVSGKCQVSEYDREDGGGIRPHEATLVKRIADHRRRLLERNAVIKPVLISCASLPALEREMREITEINPPEISFRRDETFYELFPVRDPNKIQSLQRQLRQMEGSMAVADGHHRISTVKETWLQLGDRYAFIPIIIMPGNSLSIDTFIRSVLPSREGAHQLNTYFHLTELETPTLPKRPGEWLLGWRGKYYTLSIKNKSSLTDPEWFDKEVLANCFGVTDSRTDDRLQSTEADGTTEGFIQLAQAKPDHYHFLGFPLSIDRFLECVQDGRLLPPKSTYFHPRIPTGLLVYDY